MIEFVVDVYEPLHESAQFTSGPGFQLGLE